MKYVCFQLNLIVTHDPNLYIKLLLNIKLHTHTHTNNDNLYYIYMLQ